MMENFPEEERPREIGRIRVKYGPEQPVPESPGVICLQK